MATGRVPIPGRSDGGSGAGATIRALLPGSAAARASLTDALFIVLSVLDVWLVVPSEAPGYTVVVSLLACASLAVRRWFPFTVLLATLPGFLLGWSELAAMLALGLLALRKQGHWHVWVAAGLAWLCRFVQWPPEHFAGLTWREHVLSGLYALIVAGMPVAIGLLIGARAQLAARFTELTATRDRERQWHAQAIRAEERAKLARDMHDIVSHDITLIAMQSGGLTVAGADEQTRETARTIRQLSTHTLEELRSLLGMLRSDTTAHEDEHTPDITEVHRLIDVTGVPTELTMDPIPASLPSNVSAAAYRTVQECLTNIGKHAPGAHADVAISYTPETLCVRVSNGPGSTNTDPGALPSGGHGLGGLTERARLLGGSFETAVTDGGFEATAKYPLR